MRVGLVGRPHGLDGSFFVEGPSERADAFATGSTLYVDGVGRVLFCHATPQNDVDIFTERTPEERIAPQFANLGVDLVVCGHTHMQFVRPIADVNVVNSGSVGMAYEDSPGAYWLLLGPGIESRHTAFILDTGDYPVEWPSLPREEAVAFFETLAVGA